MTDFNTKKSRQPWVRGNISGFFTSLLTGKFNTGFVKHTALFGADYMRSDQRITSAFFGPPGTPSTNVYDLVHAPDFGAISDYSTAKTSWPWFGIYGQDQIELPYHVHLLAGLRYDTADNNSSVKSGINALERVYPSTTNDKISPRGGILWQPLPELSLYGSYTENFGASQGNFNATPLNPQTAEQWEVGSKTELFDGKLSATLAYYNLKKQNLRMQDSIGTVRAIGEAETRGLEFDLTGQILPGWQVIGAYSYMPYAKTLIDTPSAGTMGKRLHNTPENSGSLWTTYDFQDEALRGLKIGAGVQAIGTRYIGYTETMKTAGYATLNLMASQMWKVGSSRVTAQLNADNLLDKTYLGGIYSYGTALYGAPRTFIGSIKIEY